MTVQEYLGYWLENYARLNVATRTFERYAEIVRLHLVPSLGDTLLRNLQPLSIQRCYVASLQSGRKDKRAGGLSAQTVVHHHRVLREALQQAVRWKLLPKIRFHDLRHTHAPQLLRQEIHPKVVSERLGHSTIGITLDVYSHVPPGMQEEAARRIDRALRDAGESENQ